MSSKVAEMPKNNKAAVEVADIEQDIANNESTFQERIAQLIANDPTASRLQGRLEILRGLHSQLNQYLLISKVKHLFVMLKLQYLLLVHYSI